MGLGLRKVNNRVTYILNNLWWFSDALLDVIYIWDIAIKAELVFVFCNLLNAELSKIPCIRITLILLKIFESFKSQGPPLPFHMVTMRILYLWMMRLKNEFMIISNWASVRKAPLLPQICSYILVLLSFFYTLLDALLVQKRCLYVVCIR